MYEPYSHVLKKLAFGLIEDCMGKVTARVCKPLTTARGKTFHQVCTEARLPSRRCAQILYVLIRHGFINIRSQGLGTLSVSKSSKIYSLNVRGILKIAKHPIHLAYARNLLGHLSAKLLSFFVLHGTLRFRDVIDLMQQSNTKIDSFKSTFKCLYEENLIEPVWATMEEAGIQISMFGKGCSRQKISEFLNSHQTLQMPDVLERVFWELNSQEIDLKLQRRECIRFVKYSLNNRKYKITSALHNFGSNDEQSCFGLSVSQGFNELPQQGTCTANEKVQCELISLREAFPLRGISESSREDFIESTTDQTSLVRLVQTRFTQTVVRRRFGDAAGRLFRLLSSTPQLEQKQISELAMIPLKDCREILGKLLKQEYVLMQEVARTADHAPSRTIYLWKVHIPSVLAKIYFEQQCSAVSLSARLRHENQGDVPSSKRDSFPRLRGRFPQIDGIHEEPSKLEFQSRVLKLELALLRVEKTMLIFSS